MHMGFVERRFCEHQRRPVDLHTRRGNFDNRGIGVNRCRPCWLFGRLVESPVHEDHSKTGSEQPSCCQTYDEDDAPDDAPIRIR